MKISTRRNIRRLPSKWVAGRRKIEKLAGTLKKVGDLKNNQVLISNMQKKISTKLELNRCKNEKKNSTISELYTHTRDISADIGDMA